jgi:DNA mismatch repair ATPase MutL
MKILIVIIILGFFQNLSSQEVSSMNEEHEAKEGLDRNYFETHYKNLPTEAAKNKAKLEYNLIKNLKREIVGRDYSKENMEKIKEINPSNIQYERVTRESKWVRGIKKAIPHIKEMEYMYIVKHDKYLCFINFHVNPENYISEPYQRELVFDGSNRHDIVIPAY